MSAARMNAIRKIGPARRVALGTVIAAGLLLGAAATTIAGRTASTADYRAASVASRDSRASERAIDALWRTRRGLDAYVLTKSQADLKDGQLADSISDATSRPSSRTTARPVRRTPPPQARRPPSAP